MLKVVTVVGTRPEIIKLSRVIPTLDDWFDHVLVHTGQNYDYQLNQVFFDQLELREPDHYLGVAGDSAIQTIANVLSAADRLLDEIAPDAMLILGDTNSCLVCIAAKKKKIPIFHMEAGNRCFDQRVPEEVNRRIVDHTCDVNLTYTEHARRYLLAEGLPPDRTIKTGSPMFEVLSYVEEKVAACDVVTEMGLSPSSYFVASVHREENVDTEENLRLLIDSLNRVVQRFDMPMVFSVHPRTRARMNGLKDLVVDQRVHTLEPMGFIEYVALQRQAACVLSDSGTITEEASILGFPAVTLRAAHERPEGMDAGVLVMTGLDPRWIVDSVDLVMKAKERGCVSGHRIDDYSREAVSVQVAKLIASYTPFVNRIVWRK